MFQNHQKKNQPPLKSSEPET